MKETKMHQCQSKRWKSAATAPKAGKEATPGKKLIKIFVCKSEDEY